MATIPAAKALTSAGWQGNVRLTVVGGTIATAEIDAVAQAGDERVAILVPGLPNLHSHAFQRAMAGLAERRGASADSFWSWRETMYRFAATMSPDQVEAVATLLYVEMLEVGFTQVGEFHYLHHAPDGRPYADCAEMAARIAAAAQTSGIGLTLLPVFYNHANFGGVPATEGQRRFVNDLDGFADLLAACRRLAQAPGGPALGIAPHSLRAVTPEELGALLTLAPDGPVHLHISEQVKEVEDCLAWSGQRPVAWLLDHAPVDARWCLIHATHMEPAEAQRLAATRAVVGLCPITEANLGDGAFATPEYLVAGGAFGIGSDSNVEIGAAAELRQLEYTLRLATRSRNVLAAPHGSTATAMVQAALGGGTQALRGAAPCGLAIGAPADFVSLDASHVALCDVPDEAILDAFVFAGGSGAIDRVWRQGTCLVEGGRHRNRSRAERRFKEAMTQLRSR